MNYGAVQLSDDVGVDIPINIRYIDVRENAESACNPVSLLNAWDYVVYPEDEELLDTPDEPLTAKETAQAAKSGGQYLMGTPDAFDEMLEALTDIANAKPLPPAKIRNIVTNGFLAETRHPDARIRLKALELLGKTEDVGLFVKKEEIIHTHQSSDELTEKIREKLNALKAKSLVLEQREDGVFEAKAE